MEKQTPIKGSPGEIYERYLVPAVFRPWAAELVSLVAPQAGESVLDVACGTGIVARLVAEQVNDAGRIVGLDLNPGQLATARAQRSPAGPPIEWYEGSADALPFDDRSFDVVLCQQGLQFFPDRPKALREMRRVLRPGGRLGLSVWRSIEHAPGWAILTEAIERRLGAEVAQLMRSGNFGLGDPVELLPLVDGAGFHASVLRPVTKAVRFPSPGAFVQIVLGSSILARAGIEITAETREAISADVTAGLSSYVTETELVMPTSTHVVTARV